MFRTVQSSSFGLNARVGRIVTRAGDVSVDLSAAWHGYLSSDAWGRGEDSPCPPEGCNTEPARDQISMLGLEVGAAYREAGAKNPIYPLAGVGLYRIGADDTTGAHVGVNAGIVIPFRRTGRGPGLEIRYFRIFAHSRFKSLLVFPLRWSF